MCNRAMCAAIIGAAAVTHLSTAGRDIWGSSPECDILKGWLWCLLGWCLSLLLLGLGRACAAVTQSDRVDVYVPVCAASMHPHLQ